MLLEIQQNEAWLPNELHPSTLKVVISKCYDAANSTEQVQKSDRINSDRWFE